MEDIAEAVEQDGLTTDGELRETIEELWAFARDPYTVLGGLRVFQAWGRRGARAPRYPPAGCIPYSAPMEPPVG